MCTIKFRKERRNEMKINKHFLYENSVKDERIFLNGFLKFNLKFKVLYFFIFIFIVILIYVPIL